MLSAMLAATGGAGTCTMPSVAAASVMLCATVNAMTAHASARRRRTSSSNANRNRR
jgi:hypothetical protein